MPRPAQAPRSDLTDIQQRPDLVTLALGFLLRFQLRGDLADGARAMFETQRQSRPVLAHAQFDDGVADRLASLGPGLFGRVSARPSALRICSSE